ncbi:MAG: STAS domain-containing protein [Tissierellia bacterium]|nr:STAS domain-containing protein [Tissierellia bacterium]
MAVKIRYLFSERSDRWEVKIIGEVDINTSTEVKEKLESILEEKQKSMIINAEELDYIDSTGLGMLIGIVKKLKQQDLELVLAKPQDSILKLFRITGLDKVIRIREE